MCWRQHAKKLITILKTELDKQKPKLSHMQLDIGEVMFRNRYVSHVCRRISEHALNSRTPSWIGEPRKPGRSTIEQGVRYFTRLNPLSSHEPKWRLRQRGGWIRFPSKTPVLQAAASLVASFPRVADLFCSTRRCNNGINFTVWCMWMMGNVMCHSTLLITLYTRQTNNDTII